MGSERGGHPSRRLPADWVVVAGGVHTRGGMEKANAALVQYLVTQGVTVHVVTHEAAPEFAASDRVRLHLVPRVLGFALTDILLDRAGRHVARGVLAGSPSARVVVNGGNCRWPDVNWVHYVHHAWRGDSRGPLPYRAKDRLLNTLYRSTERRALETARLAIVNSDRTARDVVEHIGVRPDRVRLVYLGAESSWLPPTTGERVAARARFEARSDERVVAFVGGLGYDERKGFDVLLAAWRILDRDPAFRGRLLVAGAGRRLGSYAAEAARHAWRSPVVFLGHTLAIPSVLAAADLTVSPSRYEPYGLNVQESLLRGVPAIVTRCSGIAERYTPALEPLLLDDGADAAAIAAAIRTWDSARDTFRDAAIALGNRLREHTWTAMGREFVEAVLDAPAGPARPVNLERGAPAPVGTA